MKTSCLALNWLGLPLLRYMSCVGLSLLGVTGCHGITAHDAASTAAQSTTLTSTTLPVDTLKEATDVSWVTRLRDRFQRQSRHPLEKENVSLAGLGPIQLGMTLEEAAESAGVEFEIAPGHQAQVCQYYFPVHTNQTPLDSIGLMAIEGRIIRIDIWPGSAVETVSGARIGSTEAELTALYPGQLEAAPSDSGKYLTYRSNEDDRDLYRIVFETSPEGKVTQYRAGQFPAVTWLEGCS